MLLDRLYEVGVNGKIWYDGGSCLVQCDEAFSNSFTVEKGVKQGFVLAPTLFLLVVDPFLKMT